WRRSQWSGPDGPGQPRRAEGDAGSAVCAVERAWRGRPRRIAVLCGGELLVCGFANRGRPDADGDRGGDRAQQRGGGSRALNRVHVLGGVVARGGAADEREQGGGRLGAFLAEQDLVHVESTQTTRDQTRRFLLTKARVPRGCDTPAQGRSVAGA